MMDPHVVWHDVECGAYTVDLPLWGELAANARHGVLDVGAGTGRVAIPLACNGHKVIALDNDPVLLAELERRADGLGIDTLLADATDFALPAPVSLIVVPMQTIQLLPDRSGFFASARRSLVPGGRVAISIATGLEAFDGGAVLPFPDLGEVDGYRYISQPVAVRLLDDGVRIERIRQLIAPDGRRESVDDAVHLATVYAAGLAEEGAEHGLEAEDLRHIPETAAYVGSEVVILRG